MKRNSLIFTLLFVLYLIDFAATSPFGPPFENKNLELKTDNYLKTTQVTTEVLKLLKKKGDEAFLQIKPTFEAIQFDQITNFFKNYETFIKLGILASTLLCLILFFFKLENIHKGSEKENKLIKIKGRSKKAAKTIDYRVVQFDNVCKEKAISVTIDDILATQPRRDEKMDEYIGFIGETEDLTKFADDPQDFTFLVDKKVEKKEKKEGDSKRSTHSPTILTSVLTIGKRAKEN